MQESKYTKGGFYEMLLIAVPMILSLAADAIMTFTDRIFLSKLSPDHMNAALGGGMLINTMTVFFGGLISYSAAFVSQYNGSNQKRKVTVTTFQALLIGIIVYPVLLILVPMLKPMLLNLNLPTKQIPLEIDYLSILIYGSIFIYLRGAFSSFFSGIGRAKFVMFAGLTSLVVNVACNYCLIYGKFGFPEMGIKGAAIGTNIGNAVGVVVFFFCYFRKRLIKEYHIRESFHFDKDIMRRLFKYGYPQGLESFMLLSAFTAYALIFQSEGEVAATASSIMFSWDYMSFMPLIGIQIAVTTVVGKYMGAKDIDRASKAAYTGLKLGLIYSGIIFVLYIFIPGELINLFRPIGESAVFNETYPLAVKMLRLSVLYVLSDSILATMAGALRGAGDSFATMLISVILHWIAVLELYVILKVFHVSALWGWLSLEVCFIFMAVFLFRRFKSGKWKKLDIIGNNA